MDIQDIYFGKTALMGATLNNHNSIAVSLINKGANMDIQDENGKTALLLAAQNGRTDIAASLIAKGANMDIQDNNGWTALIHAAYRGYESITLKLLDNGANVHIRGLDASIASDDYDSDDDGRCRSVYCIGINCFIFLCSRGMNALEASRPNYVISVPIEKAMNNNTCHIM